MMGAEPGRPNEPSPITRIDTARVRAVQSAAGRSFIEPGSPWQNRFVESFGSRVRDEVLSVEAFDSGLEAQTVITDWITIYNTGGHTAVSAGDCRRPMPLADHEQVGETGPALIAAGPTNGGPVRRRKRRDRSMQPPGMLPWSVGPDRARMTNWKAGAQRAGRWPRNWPTLWPGPSAF
jgi:Integrase core domain